MSELRPTPWQSKVLSIPLDVDIALLGGRGGGKSFCIAWLILQHTEQYGAHASCLYVRRDWQGLRDFEKICLQLFKAAYPDATYNLKEHVFRFPNGATVELTQATTLEQSYSKLQGRSFTLIAVDEGGHWHDFTLIDALKSNLRGPAGVHCRFVFAANPNGALHGQILKRYIRKLTAWKIQRLDGFHERVVLAPSNLDDNPTLNRAAYEASLRNAVGKDAGRYAAWRWGDWESGQSDMYFAAVWDEEHNVVPAFDDFPAGCRAYVSIDPGSLRPTHAFLLAVPRAPLQVNGRFFPARSVIAVDEVHTAVGDDLNAGSGAPYEDVAADIERMWSGFNLPGRPHGVIDDAAFNRLGGRGTPSVADQFRGAGVIVQRANKGMRKGGLELMRSMFAAAHDGSGRPGLYISAACSYALSTIPFLPRDAKRWDDLASHGPDHAADSLRYAILGARPLTTTRKVRSTYDRRSSLDDLDALVRGEVRV